GGSPCVDCLGRRPRIERDSQHKWLCQAALRACELNAFEPRAGDRLYAFIFRQRVPEPVMSGVYEMIGLQAPNALATHTEASAAARAAREADHHIDASGTHGGALLAREILKADDGGGGCCFPDLGERLVRARVRVHDQHQARSAKSRGEMLDKRADGRTDRPIWEEEEHGVRA